jgi:hypothetical protein
LASLPRLPEDNAVNTQSTAKHDTFEALYSQTCGNGTEAAVADESESEPSQPVNDHANNDKVLDFVAQHFAATKDGTVSVKNLYLSKEEPDAPAVGEPERSFETNDPLEDWARDTSGGHAKLFEALTTERVVAETPDTFSFDVDACFEKFRDMVHGTTPAMFEHRDPAAVVCRETWRALFNSDRSRPGTFLNHAYLTCCPSNSDAGSFCFLVFQYLLDSPWAEKYTLGLLGQPSVQLPDIFHPDGLRFLEIMKERYLAPSMPRSAAVHLIYKKLASQIQSQPAPSPSSQKARAKVLMLIHGLWDSAHWTMKRGQESPYHLNKRLRVENNQGTLSSQSPGILLHRASHELSDRRLAQQLRKTWSSLISNYQQAPLQLSNVISTSAKDPSSIPSALDYLELVPQPLLRTWIAAMSVPVNEVRTVPQLGEKGLSYTHMCFKLLYRLDMRRSFGTDGQESLYQFALNRFVRAHFEHRYPPSTLITGLLYGLLGHDSFVGKPSLELFDWIESYVLFLAHQDQKKASLNGMLAKLMSDLANKSLPNHGVLELIIPHIHEYKSFHSVSNLLERLPKSGTKLSNTAFLDKYIDQVLQEVSKQNNSSRLGYNIHAVERFLTAHRALDATAVEPQIRIEDLKASRFFNHILARANDAHVVPLVYRNLTPDIPKEVQADLIHQFAHQYAMDRTRSCQQNWRSVRYLYLYLKIHELPIQPLFARTVVSVCITRPLSENKFVAQKKAVWVCRLVAEVEGVDVARQVEQYFWAWRGDLILKAKRELVGLGEHDWAHLSTMERLKLMSWDARAKRAHEQGLATPEER